MSTFSTRGGLYERAQKRFAVQDGKKLFTYAFFEKQRLEAMVRCCALCCCAILARAWALCGTNSAHSIARPLSTSAVPKESPAHLNHKVCNGDGGGCPGQSEACLQQQNTLLT